MKKPVKTILLFVCMVILFERAYASDYHNFMNDELSELSALLEQCEQAGINTEYEQSTYDILSMYVPYMEQDKNNGVAEYILEYNESTMLEMYENAKERMTGYLNETDTALLCSDGYNMFETYSENGILRDNSGKAVFSLGYGHDETCYNALGELGRYGATNIQMETGPTWLYTKNVCDGWISYNNQGADLTYERTDEAASDGNYSLKIVNNTPITPNKYFYMTQEAEVEPERTYYFGCDYKGNGSGISLMIDDITSKYNLYLEDNWKTGVFSFKVPAGVTSVKLTLISENKANPCYIDNFYIKKGSIDSVNILKNASLETEESSRMNPYCLSNVKTALDNAEKAGIGIDLLLSPHYFPTALEGDNIYADTGVFIKYNIDLPETRTLLEEYIRTVMETIQGHPALTSICLSNEPEYHSTNFPEYYTPKFRDYVRSKYKSIDELNEKWGTDYESFDVIEMINWAGGPAYYDWTCFNEDIMTSWHQWMADIIREYDADIPIHVKSMNYLVPDDNPYWRVSRGIDIERIDEFSSFAGTDAWAYVGNDDEFLNKMMWYDFLKSVTGKPIYNSEDHIISDSCEEYSTRQAQHVRADMWQGAMHGRSLSSIWTWKHEYEYYYKSNLILTRPDCIEAVAHTALDLRRNSEIAAKIVSKKPRIALLYSKSSRLYGAEGSNYLEQLFEAYKGLIFSGERVGFVTETRPEKIEDYKVLIVPNALNTTDKTYAEIKKFSENGGKVVLVNECFTKNEYNVDKNFAAVNADTAECLDASDYMELIKSYSENKIFLVDAETNLPVQGVDWVCVEEDGKFYLNLCSCEGIEDKNISVVYDGRKLYNVKDIINEKNIENNLKVSPYTPVLISFETEEPSDICRLSADENNIVSWQAVDQNKYLGADVYLINEDKAVFIESVASCSFVGESGKTYDICAVGCEKPHRITLGDENIFQLRQLESNNYIRLGVKNKTQDVVYASAALIARDGDGKIVGINACCFSLGPGNYKELQFKNCYNAEMLEAVVLDGLYSKKHLSNKLVIIPPLSFAV